MVRVEGLASVRLFDPGLGRYMRLPLFVVPLGFPPFWAPLTAEADSGRFDVWSEIVERGDGVYERIVERLLVPGDETDREQSVGRDEATDVSSDPTTCTETIGEMHQLPPRQRHEHWSDSDPGVAGTQPKGGVA